MLFVPPPKYKFKLTNQDERDALALLCNLADNSQWSHVLLADKLKLKLANIRLAGNPKTTIKLEAHEAEILRLMCIEVNEFENLSHYNQAYNRNHANAVHTLLADYFNRKHTATQPTFLPK